VVVVDHRRVATPLGYSASCDEAVVRRAIKH
jgi:hypothetical protein